MADDAADGALSLGGPETRSRRHALLDKAAYLKSERVNERDRLIGVRELMIERLGVGDALERLREPLPPAEPYEAADSELGRAGLADLARRSRQKIAAYEGAVIDVSEGEIFVAAFDDVTGRAYWNEWLALPLDAQIFARLFAAHVARNAANFDSLLKEIGAALLGLAGAGAREGVESLMRNPMTRQFVPRSLNAVVGSPKVAGELSARNPSGAPTALNWKAVEAALHKECQLQGGTPHNNHSDPNWRKKAHAYEWVLSKFGGADGGPSETTLKDNVGPMLNRIQAKLSEGGN